MRRLKWPLPYQGLIPRQHAGDAVDLRHLQSFVERERRENGGKRPCEQRFACPRRAGHGDVMPSGRRHLQGALRMLLAPDFAHVGSAGQPVRHQHLGIVGFDLNQAVEVGDELLKRVDWIDRHLPHHGRLARIVGRNVGDVEACLLRDRHHRQYAVRVSNSAVERQLADK